MRVEQRHPGVEIGLDVGMRDLASRFDLRMEDVVLRVLLAPAAPDAPRSQNRTAPSPAQRPLRLCLQDRAVSAEWMVVDVGSSRVDLQACKLEYSIVSPK